MDVKQALECVKQLNHNDRAFIAHCLISSLDTQQDEDTEMAWAELAQKRYEELVSGKSESVHWEDIKKKIKGQT